MICYLPGQDAHEEKDRSMGARDSIFPIFNPMNDFRS